MRHVLKSAILLLLFFHITLPGSMAAVHHPGSTVPLCSREITFTASYLAQVTPNAGPGYLFRIENKRGTDIALAEPVPSSAHWYARVGNRWLWRASSGAGGSYVDAINEKGEVFAYQPKVAPVDQKYITVPAHGKYEWTVSEKDDPAIAYKPSCALCNYPGEHEYKAVFAYAYLPHAEEHAKGLLMCGLRSNLVDMPPKEIHK